MIWFLGEYKVGVLYDSKQGNYIRAVLQAERDINQLSESGTAISSLFPVPRLQLSLRNVSSASVTRDEAVRRLKEEEDISVFLGSPDMTSVLVRGSSANTTVQVGATDRSTARAYLHAINRSSEEEEGEEGEVVSVLPLLRDDPQSQSLLASLEQEAAQFPRVSLLPGLVHSPTNYTRSDALDLAAAVMRECVLVARCHILLISLDHPELLLRATIKTRLSQSRWWLLEEARSEAAVAELAELGRQGLHPAVLGLQYTGERREERVRARYLASPGAARGYQDWLAYNTVIRLHRALAQLSADRADWSDENIVEALRQDQARQDRTDTFALLSFRMQDTEVITLPDIPWLVRGVLEVNRTGVRYEEMKTISLTRREVETLYETVKPDCPRPEFVVRVADSGSGVIPASQQTHSLSSLPRVFILPALGSVSLSLSCNETVLTNYSCSPVREPGEHGGDTTCFLFRQSRRAKRESVTSVGEEMSKIRAEVTEIVEEWQELTPRVIGCYSSIAGQTSPLPLPCLTSLVAGCDFCFYFFSSYNISVSPGACSTGCLMGTIGSCATIISQVLLAP